MAHRSNFGSGLFFYVCFRSTWFASTSNKI